MNENENNFESLRRLLAQKRNETPPPGYFDSFSSQVVARIRAGEAKTGPTEAEGYFAQAPWLSKILQAFEFKPAFAGAFASALSLLLVFGIVYAERPDSAPEPIFQAADQPINSFAAVSPATLGQQPVANDVISSNTAAATSLQPVASLFGSQNTFAQPVSFSPSGN